ncbi:DHS-like NAD/FAD-binding domain-containing protein [Trichophaea hybrida]|nr:DHS-like NAD/FAD-binding domain-containing protein [Trichophaea hybrida]
MEIHRNARLLRCPPKKTLILTGAGISVDSGLSDYRGEAGTYRLNRSYRPIFFHEFTANHVARQRYWARSFLGWPEMESARQNAAHRAVRELWRMGLLSAVVTQNVDSLHRPWEEMEVVELHGTLREVVCLGCGYKMARREFQRLLAGLNPEWVRLMEQGRAEVRMNPDGDVDMPGVEYAWFRYPPCPRCVRQHPGMFIDNEAGWCLKPCVTFFGESVVTHVKVRAEELVEEAAAVLVVGTSLATYSAWRLVREADRRGKGIGLLNLGGVRGEEGFFVGGGGGGERVRLEFGVAPMLTGVVEALGGRIEGGMQVDHNGVAAVAGMGLGG